jgi:hypothetical protein
MNTAAPRKRIRTPEEAFEAGRELRRRQGVKLTEAQAARVAAILRPHLSLWREAA